MTSSNTAATRQGRRKSDKSVSQPKRSSGAPAPNTTTRTRRSSTSASASASTVAGAPAIPSSPPLASAVRDSTQSTFGGSVFSRVSHSTAATAATAASVPEETADQVPHWRDSFVSIVDDPFFQRLDTSHDAEGRSDADASPDYDAPPAARNDSDDRELSQRWPPPRRESLTIGQSHILLSNYQHPISTMESFNVAIIGADGVGKTTFVQRVLDLARPPTSVFSTARMSVDSKNYLVTLVELNVDQLELSPGKAVKWPKQVNGQAVSRVDSALLLYDVMTRESIRDLPKVVAALGTANIPTILVACQCDNPEDDWEIDADEIAEHKYFKSCVANFNVSVKRPDLARACVQSMLRTTISHKRADEPGDTSPRRRAQSAAHLEAPDAGGRPLSQHSKHSRASSDFSATRGFASQQSSDGNRAQNSKHSRAGFRMEKSATDSFLEIDESGESRRNSDDIPLLQRGEDAIPEKSPKVTGVEFDDLVDRLLAPRLSKADNSFSDIFLCLYRKFAAPGQLFSAVLVRLDRVRDERAAHYLTKTATQLRIIEVVAKWVSLYPGDFARPTTRRNLENFIKHLSTEPIFSVAARQMRRNLDLNVIEDDDTGWANCDTSGDEIASKILSKEMAELSSGLSSMQFDADGDTTARSGEAGPKRNSRTGSQPELSSVEEYEQAATMLEPSDHLPMIKVRYHMFMEISDDDIAMELTRIDWIMFSSIRVRDFVRHVSLSAAQKEKCKSLQNVNRMINHFNHIAKWVANMILLRDKAKHRAQMMEKFMNIALKLRTLNNYNGLAAILAGINGTAIHRLAQTRALVSAEVQKRFARLVILMGTQKSHFAYRLAWENSSLPRIPFIPLHRRDLVSAEEGSKTFVGPQGDRINWKKFEVLGEVLLPIMKSQGAPYSYMTNHDTARNLILGCRMPTDEEEIYQRSIQVESTNSGPVEPSKKKFPWFAK